MKGEEKHRRKNRNILSKGIILLILLILAAQFGYFVFYIIRDFRQISREGKHNKDIDSTAAYVGTEPDTPVSGSEKKTQSETGNAKYVDDVATSDTPRKSDSQRPSSDNTQTNLQERQKKYIYDGWKWDMVELNTADSSELDALPGIGPYYARQILTYREKLWGRYHDVSQLMEIRGIDTALFAKIEPRIYIEAESVEKYDLYAISADSLKRHPYIGPYVAKGIERLRNIIPRDQFSISALVENRIISPAQERRLKLCFK